MIFLCQKCNKQSINKSNAVTLVLINLFGSYVETVSTIYIATIHLIAYGNYKRSLDDILLTLFTFLENGSSINV